MKAVSVITLILVVVAAILGARVYLENREESMEYPIHRTLTSADGRSLDVVIHGRSTSNLSIERLSDGQRFDLPIAKLDAVDREFTQQLPVTKKESKATTSAPRAPAKDSADSFIQSRVKAIADLRSKRTALLDEIETGSFSDLIAKNRKNELKRVDKEIEGLQSDITQYKYRNKMN